MAFRTTAQRSRVARAVLATAAIAGMIALQGCAGGGDDVVAESSYPERTITYVIPYDPGGAVDAAGREFARQLGEELGGTVAPVNQPGGSGLVGVTATVTAEPDGYTLGFGAPGGILIQPLVDPTIATASTDDYTAIALMGTGPFALLVGGGSEWDSIEDLVEYAEDNPGELQIATTGGLAINTFVIYAFADAAGIEVTPIPFDGSAEGQRALLAGQVDALIASASGVTGLVDSGDVKALAVTGSTGSADLPDTPTFDSLGYDVPFEGTYTTVAPKGLPEDVLQRILDAATAVLTSDEWKEWCEANGTTPQALVGDDVVDYIHDQQDALEPYLELVQGG